jgi:hypothetical protein
MMAEVLTVVNIKIMVFSDMMHVVWCTFQVVDGKNIYTIQPMKLLRKQF